MICLLRSGYSNILFGYIRCTPQTHPQNYSRTWRSNQSGCGVHLVVCQSRSGLAKSTSVTVTDSPPAACDRYQVNVTSRVYNSDGAGSERSNGEVEQRAARAAQEHHPVGRQRGLHLVLVLARWIRASVLPPPGGLLRSLSCDACMRFVVDGCLIHRACSTHIIQPGSFQE